MWIHCWPPQSRTCCPEQLPSSLLVLLRALARGSCSFCDQFRSHSLPDHHSPWDQELSTLPAKQAHCRINHEEYHETNCIHLSEQPGQVLWPSVTASLEITRGSHYWQLLRPALLPFPPATREKVTSHKQITTVLAVKPTFWSTEIIINNKITS